TGYLSAWLSQILKEWNGQGFRGAFFHDSAEDPGLSFGQLHDRGRDRGSVRRRQADHLQASERVGVRWPRAQRTTRPVHPLQPGRAKPGEHAERLYPGSLPGVAAAAAREQSARQGAEGNERLTAAPGSGSDAGGDGSDWLGPGAG